MRKKIKAQLDNLLILLEQAHCEIQKLIDKNKTQECLSLLEDCQNCAISIGTMVEQSEGVGFITVNYLEEYCELLYLLHKELQENGYSKVVPMLKEIFEKFIQIKNSITYDIKIKKQMVFFPYKASMWDSLESIWKAANEAGKYECHVIPIPYFDKNSDGEVCEMHYEGNMYPDYVPVESWENYNVEEEHPEIIFIHNPYDNSNIVTTVHPNYYAKILRNQTDLLVYSPYFVSAEKVREHLCINPGTLYSDVVVLQSEHIRQQYITFFNDFEEKNKIKGLFGKAEEKFVATGSPKIDKIRFSQKEDFNIPDDWKKIIGDKKIVLYNTHLSEVINYKEGFFNRLHSLLKYFKASKDYALWWRPHPLSSTAVSSMSPDFFQKYQKLVEEYKKTNIGIYDDTPDLNRAICVADIYYGINGGSLVPLWGSTGKPMIFQNLKYTDIDNQKERNVAYNILTTVKERIYIAVEPIHNLFYYDLTSKKLIYECELPTEFEFGVSWKQKCFYINGSILICSCESDYILKYNLKNKKMNIVHLNNALSNDNCLKTNLYAQFFKYKDKIIILPTDIKSTIAVYNPSDDNIKLYNNWQNSFKENIKNTIFNIRISCSTLINDVIYLVAKCAHADVILAISAVNFEFIKIINPIEKGEILAIKAANNGFWLECVKNNCLELILWNEEAGIKKSLDLSEYFDVGQKRTEICKYKDKLILSPFATDELIEIDIKKMCVTSVMPKSSVYYSDADVYLLDYKNKTIKICSDSNDNLEIKTDSLYRLAEEDVSNKIINRFVHKFENTGVIIKEKEAQLLPDILEILNKQKNFSSKCNIFSKMFRLEELPAGKIIYKYCDTVLENK